MKTIHQYPLQGKQKSFNETFYALEKLDVALIQPNLIRDVPDEFVDPIERAFFSVNGNLSDDSFADTPVEANWGLLSIGDRLLQSKYRVAYLDFNLYDYVKRINTGESITLGDIADIFDKKKASVYAISCMTASINQGIRIAKLLKVRYQNAYVVLGGIHPTLFAEDILKQYAGIVDFVIQGEGELPILAMLNQLKNGNNLSIWPVIPGLCFLSDDKVIINQPNQLKLETEDSTLNFSFWPSDVPFVPRINLSRGCMGKCVYCSANRFFNFNYRLRTKDNIITDIESCVKSGYDKLLFGDLSFGCDRQMAIDICQYIVDKQIKIEFWCQMRLMDCDSELLKLMSKAGCNQIALGFESATAEILATVSAEKGSSRGLFEVCQEINNYGIAIQGYFVLGLPDETRESALKTIDLMESLLSYDMTYVHISVCVPFPGTDLFEHPEKYKIEIVDYDFDNYLMNSDLNGVALPVFNGEFLNRLEILSLWRYALSVAEKRLSKRKTTVLSNSFVGIYCERFYQRLVG